MEEVVVMGLACENCNFLKVKKNTKTLHFTYYCRSLLRLWYYSITFNLLSTCIFSSCWDTSNLSITLSVSEEPCRRHILFCNSSQQQCNTLFEVIKKNYEKGERNRSDLDASYSILCSSHHNRATPDEEDSPVRWSKASAGGHRHTAAVKSGYLEQTLVSTGGQRNTHPPISQKN